MLPGRALLLALLLAAPGCSASAAEERAALLGIWQLSIGADGCPMTIVEVSGGIEGTASCDANGSRVNVGPDCDRVSGESLIVGTLLDQRFDAHVDGIVRYEGSGCAALGVDTSSPVVTTQGSLEATRAGGSGAFEGSWALSVYEWRCSERSGASGPCLATSREGAILLCDLTVRDVGSGDFDMACHAQDNTCEGNIDFSGSYVDGKADYSAHWSNCDGSKGSSGRFTAVRQ